MAQYLNVILFEIKFKPSLWIWIIGLDYVYRAHYVILLSFIYVIIWQCLKKVIHCCLILGFLLFNSLKHYISEKFKTRTFEMQCMEWPQVSQSSYTTNLCCPTFCLHHCQSASFFGIKEVYTPGEVFQRGKNLLDEDQTVVFCFLCRFGELLAETDMS